jgi:hypothetical protein
MSGVRFGQNQPPKEEFGVKRKHILLPETKRPHFSIFARALENLPSVSSMSLRREDHHPIPHCGTHPAVSTNASFDFDAAKDYRENIVLT